MYFQIVPQTVPPLLRRVLDGHRIVRMRRPVAVLRIDRPFGARINATDCFHCDAILDRANADAQIATDAFFVDHLKAPLAVDGVGDRLVRGVLAYNMAAAAFDAQILVDPRLCDIIEIEMLPVGDVRRRQADEIVDSAIALLVHPCLKALNQFGDDLEAIGHHRIG